VVERLDVARLAIEPRWLGLLGGVGAVLDDFKHLAAKSSPDFLPQVLHAQFQRRVFQRVMQQRGDGFGLVAAELEDERRDAEKVRDVRDLAAFARLRAMNTMGEEKGGVEAVGEGRVQGGHSVMVWQEAQWRLEQSYCSAVRLHVRTATDTGSTIEAIRQAFRELDPDLPITETVTMNVHMEEAVFAQRIGATLLGIFGALALTLAAVGLYSVMSYAVSQRTHEMGIRLALGASPGELRSMVVSSGMKVTGLGLTIGAAGAAGVSRLLTSLLNGVSPTDPLTFATVLGALAAVAFLAALIPARRASTVDPIVALRYE